MSQSLRRLLALWLLLILSACAEEPERDATPALWEIRGLQGEQGWLFGTVHVLPRGLDWRTPELNRTLERSDLLVLEIHPDALDPTGARRVFRRLGTSPGLPPLTERVRPDLRDELARLVRGGQVDPNETAGLEDWAAALALAQAQAAQQGMSSARGVEPALLERAGKRPVEALETVPAQFALFDALPSSAQSALLEAVVAESADPAAGERLLDAWASGDVAALEREGRNGMLANATLRQALLIDRNAVWAERVDRLLRAGHRPFVAVGAAHVAGPEGLPALLAARGWEVRRVQ